VETVPFLLSNRAAVEVEEGRAAAEVEGREGKVAEGEGREGKVGKANKRLRRIRR